MIAAAGVAENAGCNQGERSGGTGDAKESAAEKRGGVGHGKEGFRLIMTIAVSGDVGARHGIGRYRSRCFLLMQNRTLRNQFC